MSSDTRNTVLAAAALTIAAWVYTIHSAGVMTGAMPMPGGWSMSMVWMPMGKQPAIADAAMFLVMWTAMMVAMMLPSVMPVVLLHRRLVASRLERRESPAASNALLLAGYFGIWTALGLVPYAVGVAVGYGAMRHAQVSRAIPVVTGLTLMFAGVYQLTSWKRACLSHCRSPLEFLSHHPVRGPGDSFLAGLHHGAYCVGCCGALMVIQLALGVMNVPIMVAVTLVILLEKTWKYGEGVATVAGVVAVAAGALLVFRAPF